MMATASVRYVVMLTLEVSVFYTNLPQSVSEGTSCGRTTCLNGGRCVTAFVFLHSCTCTPGYTGSSCETDINECEDNICDASSSKCKNTKGSYYCQCIDGYSETSTNDGVTRCNDINECDDHVCDANSTQCQNTEGSYLCSCKDGYSSKSTSDGVTKCNDTNECNNNVCDNTSTECENTKGSYHCSCKDGFSRKSTRAGVTKCHDVNECDDHVCDVNSTDCENTKGSYLCSCKDGFSEKFTSAGVTKCNDVNECDDNVCDATSTECQNTEGSYHCRCKDGYSGKSTNDGVTKCHDVNECEDNVCDVTTTECENTNGSYRCNCKDGYSGNSTNAGVTKCNDVNECEGKFCDVTSTDCENTNGSYRCHCKDGYFGNITSSGVTRCNDIDECDDGFGFCDATSTKCKNTKGSYYCQCKDGYSENSTKAGVTKCNDINECDDNVCDVTSTECENTIGSYRCLCKSGYSEMPTDSKVMKCNGSSPVTVVASLLGCFVTFLVLLTVAIILFRRRGKEQKSLSSDGTDNQTEHLVCAGQSAISTRNTNDNGFGGEFSRKEDMPVQMDFKADQVRYISDENNYNNVGVHEPRPVKVSEFADYVLENSHQFEDEYSFLTGKTRQHPWTIALNPANVAKNRFKNMYTYDHSRVVLEQIRGDSSTDYYNASFVMNHRGEQTYIASQAPNKASIDDFWQLIWEQEVYTIVMVTKLIEDGKDRCYMYWPQKKGESKVFGSIKVTLAETLKSTEYEVRTLSLQMATETRDVVQLHFQSWPDKNVPEHGTPLIEFAREVKSIHHDRPTPILVHCSAGVGRTGTFIALYDMIDVLETKEYIDVFAFVNQMRENRVNMIQTERQYSFLHQCLYEYHMTSHCEMPSSQLAILDMESKDDNVADQFELLSHLPQHVYRDVPDEDDDNTILESAGMRLENATRNRFSNMIHSDRHRVFLTSTSPHNPENYINASFVKSFEKRNAYITTQSPLPGTMEDFWRMIYDYKCEIVAMLNQLDFNDKSCPQYWPDRGSQQYGLMTVKCVAMDRYSSHVKRSLEVTYGKKTGVVSVIHMQLEEWPPEGALSSVVDLIKDVENLQRERLIRSPIVVHCINGFDRSGVFVVVKSEMERIRATGHVNVFSTTRKLRNDHKYILKKKADFILCFRLLQEYINVNSTYENWG